MGLTAASIPKKLEERLIIKKISALSDKEITRFSKYIANSNVKENVQVLWKYILKGFQKESLSDVCAHEAVWPKAKFSNTNLNKLVSTLNKVFDDFLEFRWNYHSGVKGDIERQLVLLRFYSEKGMSNSASLTIKRISKLLESLPHKESFYYETYYRLYKFYDIGYHQDPINSAALQKNRTHALDRFYFFNKLKHVGALINYSITNTNSPISDEQTALLQNILDHIDKEDYKNEAPALLLWKEAVELLKEPEAEARFNQLEKSLYEHYSILSPQTANDFFVILLNSFLKIEKDKVKGARKLLEYYLFQIEKDIIFFEGFFVSFVFENIVSTGLKAKSPEWVLKFIDDYGYRLHPDGRKGSIVFGRAKCYFVQGKFSESLEQLEKIKGYQFKNVFINIYVRILRIKAYYDIEFGDPKYDRHQPDRDIASFRKFISNHQSEYSDEFQLRFKNFAAVTTRLISCTTKSKADSLAADLKDKFKIVEDRIWLEAKLEELQRDL